MSAEDLYKARMEEARRITKETEIIIAKAELFKDLIDCIDNLIADKAHMPSVEHLLKEAKEL